MIYKGAKEVSAIYYGRRIIAEVYKGATLIWQAIRSCFGNGFWINEKPYDNIEGWKN